MNADERDYGPVVVGDRVIVRAPGGRAGSAKARANGCEGVVTKAGPKNLTIELDEGRTILACRSLVVKNNSGRRAPCGECGGLNGAHGLVHARYGNGGGGNRPCSREHERLNRPA